MQLTCHFEKLLSGLRSAIKMDLLKKTQPLYLTSPHRTTLGQKQCLDVCKMKGNQNLFFFFSNVNSHLVAFGEQFLILTLFSWYVLLKTETLINFLINCDFQPTQFSFRTWAGNTLSVFIFSSNQLNIKMHFNWKLHSWLLDCSFYDY